MKYKELYRERVAILEEDGWRTKEAEEQAAFEIKWMWIEDENLDMWRHETYTKIRKFEKELNETH